MNRKKCSFFFFRFAINLFQSLLTSALKQQFLRDRQTSGYASELLMKKDHHTVVKWQKENRNL